MRTPVSSFAIEFIDFGCGSGLSLPYARKLAGGDGFGIDISSQAVSECWAAGLPAEIGDLLSYSGKNTATVTTAINLLPEIGNKDDFEQAVSRMIIAARNYAVIQHEYFDADSALALAGLCVIAHFSKKIRYKPVIADYLVLLGRIAASHSISGVAIFGLSEARLAPLLPDGFLPRAEGAADAPAGIATYRSIRVVIGRKEVSRFRVALRKTRAGQELFLWERPDPSAE